jgi:iron(II)-dependent oxidoreductase
VIRIHKIIASLLIVILGLIIVVTSNIASGEVTLTFNPTATPTSSIQWEEIGTFSLSDTTPAVVPGTTSLPTLLNSDWTSVIQAFDGVEMALVPAGCFMMGSTNEQIMEAIRQCMISDSVNAALCSRRFGPDRPAHVTCIEQPFWIDRYEVSNAQFEAFDGQAGQPGEWTGAERPRETITWFEARDFCISRGARLPTEAEWEYAARGPEGWIYPWGNDFVESNVVYYNTSDNQTADIGSRPDGASWVGALDMSGNVMEWVSSIDSPYPYNATDGREDQDDTTSARSHRGGSWLGFDFMQRIAVRWPATPDSRYGNVGFRCAHSD